jgi:predicted Zn-dependent protease
MNQPLDLAQAQQELQRAYLLLSYADTEAARAACARARAHAPDHPMPVLLDGSILIAAGQLRDALALLRRATQRWPNEPLAHIYLAEANLLLGRRDAGLKCLATAQALDAQAHATLIESLRELFSNLDPATLPAPLLIAS